MATLHNYKCHKCGFSILSSKDGDNSLLSGSGHFINVQNAITSLQRTGYIRIYT